MKYYSEKLNKIFDTTTVLAAEELEYDKRKAEEKAKAEKEKQEREAKEAERTKAREEVELAYKHFLELENAYIKKYYSESTSNDILSGLIDLLFKD
jgi:hypothetical protein